jgi:hypothetical protein
MPTAVRPPFDGGLEVSVPLPSLLIPIPQHSWYISRFRTVDLQNPWPSYCFVPVLILVP